jgi:hypothetical protein
MKALTKEQNETKAMSDKGYNWKVIFPAKLDWDMLYTKTRKQAIDLLDCLTTSDNKGLIKKAKIRPIHNIVISDGNTKLGKLPNFSLSPVLSCPNCKDCSGTWQGKKFSCYANKATRLYPSARKAWSDNLFACEFDLESVEKQIVQYLELNRPIIFRIHSAGDFFNQQYLDMWIRIAKRFSDVKFLAFTKAYKLNYRTKPRNLKIIYSVMPATKLSDVPRGTRAYAGKRPITNKRIFDCPGNCENCGICWNLNSSENVFFKLH